MLTWTVLVSVLLPTVIAQASGDLDLSLKAIAAHFNQSHIVPNFLPSFQPTAILNVNFNGNVVPGQLFAKEAVNSAPVLSVQSSSPLSGQYTLAMMDADIVDADISAGTNRHWLLNGVTVQDSTVSNSSATVITRYWGPWPAPGSGPHRYVITLYEQTSAFTAPAEFTENDLPVAPMDWNTYVTNSNLGPLVAANYILVEEGTATVQVPSTQSVITSTLVPTTSTGTSAGTSAPTSSTTNTATNSNSNTNGASSTFVHMSFVMALALSTTLILA